MALWFRTCVLLLNRITRDQRHYLQFTAYSFSYSLFCLVRPASSEADFIVYPHKSWTVTASTNYSELHSAGNLIDGKLSTFWHGPVTSHLLEEWIQVHFGKTIQVSLLYIWSRAFQLYRSPLPISPNEEQDWINQYLNRVNIHCHKSFCW